MDTEEKEVAYNITNTYSTLNRLNPDTEYVWMVFHGIGYLSRYFLRYFDELTPEKHYVVAPQASPKYYLNGEYKHVGASWLTKENTQAEIENVLSNIDAVWQAEHIPDSKKLIVLGYSQGVSVAMRWVAGRQISCDSLVLYAGGIPNELTSADFAFLAADTEIISIVGDKDPYLTRERREVELQRSQHLFGDRCSFVTFEGGHEVKKTLLSKIWRMI